MRFHDKQIPTIVASFLALLTTVLALPARSEEIPECDVEEDHKVLAVDVADHPELSRLFCEEPETYRQVLRALAEVARRSLQGPTPYEGAGSGKRRPGDPRIVEDRDGYMLIDLGEIPEDEFLEALRVSLGLVSADGVAIFDFLPQKEALRIASLGIKAEWVSLEPDITLFGVPLAAHELGPSAPYGGRPPNDPLFPSQAGLWISKFPDAWGQQTGSDDVTVAVIDSGLDLNQADLNEQALWSMEDCGRLVHGRNFCRDCEDRCGRRALSIRDLTGHGTALAGVVGAETSNRLRVAGTNRNVRLMPLKFLQADNRGRAVDAAAAVCFAARNEASLILAAWGTPRCKSTPLKNAIAYARDREVLFVAAAGNDGLDLDVGGNEFYPASYSTDLKNMVVVGATRADDTAAPYSNCGESTVHLGAPGVRTPVLGPERSRPVWAGSGTSVAAAYVAGAAALVYAQWLDKYRSQPSYGKIKACLLSVENIDLPWRSGGRLDADRAVGLVARECQ